jgi:hypothetical protein
VTRPSPAGPGVPSGKGRRTEKIIAERDVFGAPLRTAPGSARGCSAATATPPPARRRPPGEHPDPTAGPGPAGAPCQRRHSDRGVRLRRRPARVGTAGHRRVPGALLQPCGASGGPGPSRPDGGTSRPASAARPGMRGAREDTITTSARSRRSSEVPRAVGVDLPRRARVLTGREVGPAGQVGGGQGRGDEVGAVTLNLVGGRRCRRHGVGSHPAGGRLRARRPARDGNPDTSRAHGDGGRRSAAEVLAR